jgi:hypothetical protein
MIQVGMGYENILQGPLFLLGQHRPDGAGIQQQLIVDQKRRGPEVGKFRTGASQNP